MQCEGKGRGGEGKRDRGRRKVEKKGKEGGKEGKNEDRIQERGKIGGIMI